MCQITPNSNWLQLDLVQVLTEKVCPKGKHRAPNGQAAKAYNVKLQVLKHMQDFQIANEEDFRFLGTVTF